MSCNLFPLACLVLFVGCAGPGRRSETPAVPADLQEADRAFAADTAARGLEGWLAWFAPDAARFDLGSPTASRGKAAISAADGPLFARPDLTLEWEPVGAGLFEGGELGYTTGPYRLVRRDDAGETVVGRGHYLSIWRRFPEGWRVLLDTGAPE